MNKQQVKGRVDEAKGKVKEVAGHVVGNPRPRPADPGHGVTAAHFSGD